MTFSSSLEERALSLFFFFFRPALARTHTYTDFLLREPRTHTKETWDWAPPLTYLYPSYKSVQITWATRTGHRVLLFGGPNQYKSLCPISHTIRGPTHNPRNLLASSYRTPTASLSLQLCTKLF
jgi:hypothetical protein